MDPKVSLLVDGLTDLGNRRQNNEDAWWAGQLGGPCFFMTAGPAPLRLTTDGGPVLLMVSDGVGGANAGEVASQMAIRQISSDLVRDVAAFARPKTAGQAVLAALTAADAAVMAKSAEPGFDGMGATLSLLCVTAAGAWWGQAGDSRIYVFRDGKLRQFSHDHSPVGRMRQRGEITEAEARRHPLRNQIDQSLGNTGTPFRPETGTEPVFPGDVFLLCSDGLCDGLWDHEIEKLLAGVQAAVDVRPAVLQLVAAAKQASGRDNITAVVALVEDVAPARVPSRAKYSLWQRLFGSDAAPA